MNEEGLLTSRIKKSVAADASAAQLTIATIGTVIVLMILVAAAAYQDYRRRAIEAASLVKHTLVLKFEKAELERTNTKLSELVGIDGLTGLKNDRGFNERLSEEVRRAKRYRTDLSIVALHIDHFTDFRDSTGPGGEGLLCEVGRILNATMRTTDIVAQLDQPGEFAIILTQTDRTGANVAAERIREKIATHNWPLRSVTASVGIATWDDEMASPDNLINCSHEALCHSKAVGRNRVTHFNAIGCLSVVCKKAA